MTSDKAMHPNHPFLSSPREKEQDRRVYAPAQRGQIIAGHPAVSNYTWMMATMQGMEETAVRVRYSGKYREGAVPTDGSDPFYRGIRAEMRSRFGATADQVRIEAKRNSVAAALPINYANKRKPRLGMDIPLCIPFEDFFGLWLRTVEIDFASYGLTIGTLLNGKKGYHVVPRDLQGDPVEPVKEEAALRLARHIGIISTEGDPTELLKQF